MKIFAFILLAVGTVALSYGNAPAKRIQDCENAGVGQAVCAAFALISLLSVRFGWF